MIQNFPKKSTMIISQGCFENFRKFSIYFFQFGPGKDEKIGFKVVNLNSEVIVIMDFSKKGGPIFFFIFVDRHKVSVLIGKPRPRQFLNTPYI